MNNPGTATFPFRLGESVIGLTLIALVVGLLATPYYPLALLPAIGVLGLLFLGRYPQAGYHFIVFLIPYSAYRGFAENAPYLTASKMVGVVLVLYVALLLLLTKRAPLDLRSNLWPWLLLFFGVNVLSTLLSENWLLSLNTLREIGAAYLFFVLSLAFLRRRESRETLAIVLVASISIGAALSIAGYLFDIPLFAMNVESESVKRATGVAQNPNHFAAFVVFSLPILAHLAFCARRVAGRVVAGGLFLMNVAAIVLTYSRGGALVLAAVLALLVIEHLHRLKPRFVGLVVAVAALAVAAAIVLVPASYWERQRSISPISDSSVSRRLTYLTVGWRAFLQNPILGAGPGNFRVLYAESPESRSFGDTEDELRRYAHNTYLEILIGTGLVGFACFAAVVIRALANFVQARRSLRLSGRAEAASMLDAFGLSFVAILLYFALLSSQGHKYFWLSLALSEVVRRHLPGAPEAHQGDEPS